jgi:hypothetical protein
MPNSNTSDEQPIQPALRKCDVLRLRALIEQNLNREIKKMRQCLRRNDDYDISNAKREAYESVLSLMDAVLPVA